METTGQTLPSGFEFGPYTIEGFISGGGMGEVYAARSQIYGTAVALKVLHAHLHADESWRQRFNVEGVVGQQLKHPNLLSARELVEQEGRVGLVMDLVKGAQTLEHVMRREFSGGLTLTQALHVVLGILQGLEHAHEKKVVHGDIKPANVLIEGPVREPMKWNPLLTDFGTIGIVAHPVLVDGRPAVVATPRYASPEHFMGVEALRPESDIYCLGLLLHYLLTGEHASTARSVEDAATWVQAAVSVSRLIDYPESLLNLFRKATRPRAEDRFSSCRDFALAIRMVLDTQGVDLQTRDVKPELATEVIDDRQSEVQALRSGVSAPEDEGTDPIGNVAVELLPLDEKEQAQRVATSYPSDATGPSLFKLILIGAGLGVLFFVVAMLML